VSADTGVKVEPLSEQSIENFRALVDETISRWPDTTGRGALARLGLHEVTWTINSLSNDCLERAASLLTEIGFKTELTERRATDLTSPIPRTFYSIRAKRNAVFHPDYLFGEAICIGTVTEMWSCQLEGLQIDGRQTSASRTFYGALSGKIAAR
jgi:hypothetical protein